MLILNVDVWYQPYASGRKLRKRGQVIEPSSDEQRDWLIRHGVAVDSSEVAEQSEAADNEEADNNVVGEIASEPGTSSMKKPAKNRDEKVWATYAKSLGLNVSGMSKPEIMRAVEDFESQE